MLMAIVPNKYLAIRSSIWTPSRDPVHWHLQSRLLQTRDTMAVLHVQLASEASFLLIFFKYFPFPCHSAVLHCFKHWWLFRILIWSFNFAIWCFGVLHILWDTLYLVCTFLSEYIYSNCYQGALCSMLVCCRCLVLCLFNLTRIVLDLLYFRVGQWRQTKLSITVVAEVYWNYLNV